MLLVTALLSLGNSLASPGLTSLASKTADEHDQRRALGILQSGASLTQRSVQSSAALYTLNNASNTMDDVSLNRTFWTAAAIMFVAFGVAVYICRTVKDPSLA